MTKRNLELKFCGYDCKNARPEKEVPGCMTFNLIYCRKCKRQADKGGVCLDRYQNKK